jgi:HlyD family secretion protein
MIRKYGQTVLIFVLLGALVFYILKSALGPSPTLPRTADTKNSARESVPAAGVDFKTVPPTPTQVGGNAIVEPRDRETKVAGIVPGRIKALLVAEGDDVKAGQALIEFECETEKAAVSAAEGDLAAAQADLIRSQNGNRHEDIDAAMGDFQAAKARADLSAAQRERERQLAKSGASTPDELDRAERQAESDERTAKASESRAQSLAHGSRYEDILAAKARVQAAEARRNQAKVAVDNLTVRAPIAGKILQLKVRPGEYYTPGGADPLLIMGDTSVLRARVDVDERQIGLISLGRPAYVTADAFPNKKFEGTVVEIGRRMGRKNLRTDDPVERIDTKILEVVIELKAKDQLVPGLRVTGWISVDDKKG